MSNQDVRRLQICHDVIREMGTSHDDDSADRCPVVQEVERRWRLAEIGGSDWTLPEIAVVLGETLAVVRTLVERGFRKMRVSMRLAYPRARDDLRELDAMRGGHVMPEAGGWG